MTNLINGKIYIGKHKTKNKDDSYMGSGVEIIKDIKKYGIDNFVKTILFECSSEKEMNEKELEIVNKEFVNRSDTYNRTIGGYGSWYGCNKVLTKDQRSNITQKGLIAAKQLGDEYGKRIKKGLSIYYKIHGGKGSFTGRHHSENSKQLISNSHKSNFKNGFSIWNKSKKRLYNPITHKILWVNSEEIDTYLNNGWIKKKNSSSENQDLEKELNDLRSKIDDTKKKLAEKSRKEKEEKQKKYLLMYHDYISFGFEYVRQKYHYDKSRENLTGLFKKYVTEYDPTILYKVSENRIHNISFKIPEGKTKKEFYEESYDFYMKYGFDAMCNKYSYNKSKNNFLTQCRLYVDYYKKS